MMRWHGSFLRSRVIALLASSWGWLVMAVVLPTRVVPLLISLAVVATVLWSSRVLLWLRFGIRRATDSERELVLARLVPMVSMRGRGQPVVWIGRWAADMVTTPRDGVVIVTPSTLSSLAAGHLSDTQFCAVTAHALGVQPLHTSRWAASVNLYCLPVAPFEVLLAAVSSRAGRRGALRGAWAARWLVFAIAIIQAVAAQRIAAAAIVAAVAVFTWLGPRWAADFTRKVEAMGDIRARREGFGDSLASVVRQRGPASAEVSARADRLCTQEASSAL